MLLAAVLSAWLQYAADGEPHARAVVTDAACPAASADGRALPMTERARRAPQFADLVCDVVIPNRAQHVRVADRDLPVPTRNARTVVVLGDTGCRISLLSVQSCSDADAWPFPQTARTIAALHPDLVVHVGDYLYRERACPPLARCAGSPYGDDADAWYADMLTPAAPLFAAAPLLLVRGNHESCERNGAGWFRYFDAHQSTACSATTEPYEVGVGGLSIVAFDSAVAEDVKPDPDRTPIYQKQFATAGELAKLQESRAAAMRSRVPRRDFWFVTHRPPYTNRDERIAMGDALAPFDAVLAGHLHMFAAMNVESLPPLLINGEGGTKLDPNYAPFLGMAVGDLRVQGDVFGSAQFGFGVYTRAGSGWAISLRDPHGIERARCALANRAVHCTSEK